MKPVITVLMPVYNGEKYLAEAINSILSQTFRNFEFLIIDDGSTDKTSQILKKYKTEDSRIRIVSNNTNKGIVVSLNEGLRLAKGQYIARMDADDFSFRNRLELQYSYIKTHPEISVVGSRYEVIDDTGKTVMTSNTVCDETLLKWRTIFKPPVAHSSVFYRKNRIIAIGGYNPLAKYVEDYDLWVRIYLSGEMISNLNDVLLSYRRHSTSVSKINAVKQNENAEKVKKQYVRYYSHSLRTSDILCLIKQPQLRLTIFRDYLAYKKTWKTVFESFVKKESCRLSVSPISFAQYANNAIQNSLPLAK